MTAAFFAFQMLLSTRGELHGQIRGWDQWVDIFARLQDRGRFKLKLSGEPACGFIGLILDPHQCRAQHAGGVAQLMFHDGRLQFIREGIFAHGRDALGING